MATEEPILAGEALVDVSEIICLHFVEKSIQNALLWLHIQVLDWYNSSPVVDVIDKLVKTFASDDYAKLYLLDILLDGSELLFPLEVGVPGQGDRDP